MQAPKVPTMFRNVSRKPRQFSYKKKHLDEKKNEFETRKKQIEREVDMAKGKPVEEYVPGQKSFSESWRKQSDYKKNVKSSNYRLVIILLILISCAYFAIKYLENL